MGTDISMTEHLLTSCLPKHVSAHMDPGALAKDGFHNIKEFHNIKDYKNQMSC